MLISGNNARFIHELIRDREYVIATVDRQNEAGKGFHPDSCGVCSFEILEKGEKALVVDTSNYLIMSRFRGHSSEETDVYVRYIDELASKEEIILSAVDEEELIPFLSDKLLALQWNGGRINREHLQLHKLNNVFLMYEGSPVLLTDDSYDVRIYLQSMEGNGQPDQNTLVLVDVRDYDIYPIIMNMLRERCRGFFFDETDFDVEFRYEFQNIKAEYYLTRFHSNPSWNKNPVNVICSRISAFLLPGRTSLPEYERLPKKQITRNIATGGEYRIDSIYINSDIWSDAEDVKEWLYWEVWFNISLA